MGETFEEALNRFSYIGKETFSYSRHREYCYNETREADRKPIFKKELRARLYDKEGKLLSRGLFKMGGDELFLNLKVSFPTFPIIKKDMNFIL